ncbi:hypothetical protein H5410_009730 [Solanum commersonii]|uniref:Uncharacterized protein n=1 Tax=Solanum commersonii TaxID=4109 RepID=A0A9J6AIS3_SOLCO|nr:hypothetical protein H5410_009730 [Solanum commersonii]
MGTNTTASMFSSTLLPTSQAAITTFSGQNSTSAVQSDLNLDPFGTFDLALFTVTVKISRKVVLNQSSLQPKISHLQTEKCHHRMNTTNKKI